MEQLEPHVQLELEETTQTYFQEYVRAQVPGATFELVEVRMTATDILSNRRILSTQLPRSVRESSDRSLVEGIAQLRIHLLLSGFAIDINITDVVELITEAVDTDAFTAELRRSDPFFKTANVSTIPPEIPPDLVQSATDDGGNSQSTATITVSVLVAVSVFTLGAVWAVYRGRKNGCQFLGIQPKALPSFSPGMMGSQQEGSVLGFGGSPDASGHTTPHASNGLLRMLSLSLSRSHDSTSSCSTGNQSNSVNSSAEDGDVGNEQKKERETEEEPEEHPLAGIIPPMVVIDIEDDLEVKSMCSAHSENQSVGSGVPMKHVKASSALMAALSKPSHLHMTLSDIL